jgi:hypothetical protein
MQYEFRRLVLRGSATSIIAVVGATLVIGFPTTAPAMTPIPTIDQSKATLLQQIGSKRHGMGNTTTTITIIIRVPLLLCSLRLRLRARVLLWGYTYPYPYWRRPSMSIGLSF